MEGICALPEVDYELCTGCMRCMAACPGQAIFMVGPGSADDSGAALVTLPWEYLPYPAQGYRVELYGRDGFSLGFGTVTSSRMPRAYDKTRLVTLEVPKEAATEVQHCAVRENDG
jgi:Fe-S-cluster-containing hydrogenase component 2